MSTVLLIGLLSLFLLLFFWRMYTKDAPFVPLEVEVVERIMKIAEVKAGDTFYDLGSGDGRLVIAAALRGAQSYGVEIDKVRVLYSRFWIRLLRVKNAKILHKDLFDVNLRDATVVTTYLLPETHDKLKEKMKKELKPGARLVAISFEYEGWKPEKIDPRGPIYGPIMLYRL